VHADDEKQMKVLMFIAGAPHDRLDLLEPGSAQAHGPRAGRGARARDYGLGEADLDTVFAMGSFANRREKAVCARSSAMVRKTYCDTIGVEYMYLSSMEEKRWLRRALRGHPVDAEGHGRGESASCSSGSPPPDAGALHTRYVGQKRLLRRGRGELVPWLDIVIENGGAQGPEGGP